MFQIPRGTRDFTAEEMQKRKSIEVKMRKTFESYSYKEIQTPVFENLELFTAKSGQTIIDEIYAFTDKGDRKLALRPELTAPVIRFYIEKLQMQPKPLKLYYFGNCYRYDRPQKGRYREFKQAGCEIIGVNTPESIAELIAMAYNIIKNSGLKNTVLRIGNLNLLSFIFKRLNIAKEKQEYITPLIDKSLFDDLYEALTDYKISPKDVSDFIDFLQTDDIEKIKNYIKEYKESSDEIQNFEKTINFLKNSFKVTNFKIDMSIVRGLDYYSGIVFEIEAPVLGAEKQLCGGGEYQLIPLFGGRETPTAGFAIGFDRTILALEQEKHEFPKYKTDAYIIPYNKDMIEKSIKIAEELRKQGLIVDIDLMRRGISKALKYANSINTKKTIIVAPDEIKEDAVTVKDMKTGEQQKIKINEIKKEFLG